ncbi:hypothetical protein Si107_01430 [Streptococcus infantarius subsp. infantarius]|nr:hypothetical protein [Streptococcus infantarius subsp. infantarius]
MTLQEKISLGLVLVKNEMKEEFNLIAELNVISE